MDKKDKFHKIFRILSDKLLDLWEERPFLMNSIILLFLLCAITINNYFLFKINNEIVTLKIFVNEFPIGVFNLYTYMKNSLSNIMALGGALITLNGVFLTLLVTLKESEVLKKIKESFPNLHDYMYLGLKKQLYSCILLMFICIILHWFEDIKILYLQVIIVCIIGYNLINVSFGAIYSIKTVTDITTKNEPEREHAIE